MQTKPIAHGSAATTASNVIPFPIARREPPRPLWAETGLYDLDMMESYWRDMAEQFG
jgi:hypothetical protein